MPRLLAFVMLAACVPPQPAYYISDLHYDTGGNLVAEKCELDAKGRATNNCANEAIEPPGQFATPTDPPVLAKAKREADRPVEKRPAPTAAEVGKALASPGVYGAVSLCRERFAPALASFSFTFALAPSGAIAITPHDTNGEFATCASRALQGANLLAYDGAPVSFEQTLVFGAAPGA